jgi:hypothetical protein
VSNVDGANGYVHEAYENILKVKTIHPKSGALWRAMIDEAKT